MIQSAKNALITGAYGGLGRSLADAYLKAGHNLFLLGRNEQKLNKLKKYLESVNVSNRIIKCYPCDLRDVSSIDETINLIESEYEIDILINCAGTFPVKSLSQTSLRDYQDCMQINVQAPFLLMQRLSKDMIKNKWGRIVNIASSSAYGGSPFYICSTVRLNTPYWAFLGLYIRN
jgi:short-subunit dehydrogenase